jgi:hypothetical protein
MMMIGLQNKKSCLCGCGCVSEKLKPGMTMMIERKNFNGISGIQS